MRTSDLEYELPPERIAQHPADRRDASRLLVFERSNGRIRHEAFARLPELLPPAALLVFNDTRVLPARLRLRRRTGGQIEGLFLHEPQPGRWELMLSESRRLRTGERLTVEGSARSLRLLERIEGGTWRAEPDPPGEAHAILAECGQPPLPPYIKRDHPAGGSPVPAGAATRDDIERYQTIYARRPGAVAAPTAGLHFTPEIMAALQAAGFEIGFVTLHVGAGTFLPIRCKDLAEHPMHAEWYECPAATADAVNRARAGARPVVAVGTTSVRVLETCARDADQVQAGSGWTRLFIYPPYHFKVVDALLTNFHLPGSTLLAMIFALAGRDRILAAYREAIGRAYRFYSYGDAMLIL